MTQEAEQAGHWLPALRPETLPPSEGIHPAPVAPNKILQLHVHKAEHIQRAVEAFRPELVEAADADHSSDVQIPLGGPVESANAPSTTTQIPAHSLWSTDELPSDDDNERLDPAWGLNSLHPPFLATATRSTSFPDFTPSVQDRDSLPQRIPFSLEEESVQRLHEEQSNNAGFDEQVNQNGIENLDWMEDDDEPPLEYTVTKPSEAQEDINGFGESLDERFEAGVPLMQSETEHEFGLPAPIRSQSRDPFEDTGKDDDALFFANVNKVLPKLAERPHAERKSTMDVMSAVSPFPDLEDDEPETNFFSQPIQELETETLENSTNDPLKAFDKADSKGADAEAMWAAALADDEFLMEDADDLLPDSDEESAPPAQPAPIQNRTVYTPHQPTTSDMVQSVHSNIGLPRPGLAPMNSFQSHLQQQPLISSTSATAPASSFVDQSKGGYVSPYDMPLELSKPRRRQQAPQSVSTPAVPPPPRSNSQSNKLGAPGPFPQATNTPASGLPTNSARATPITSQPPPDMRARSTSLQKQAEAKTKSEASAFFEELPVASRPRPASGRYSSQQNLATLPPQSTFPVPSQIVPAEPTRVPSPARPGESYGQYQLQPPEKLDPYANLTAATPAIPLPTTTTTRYSPAPAVTGGLRVSPSYSPAPAAAGGPRRSPGPRYSPAPPPQPTAAPPTDRYASVSVRPPTTTALPAGPVPPPAPMQSAIIPPVAVAPPSPAASSPSAVPTASAPPSNRYAAAQPPSLSQLPFQPRTSSPLAQHRRSIEEQPGLGRTLSTPAKLPQPTTGLARFDTYHGAQQGRPAAAEPVIAPPRRPQSQSPGKQAQRPLNAFTPVDPLVATKPVLPNGRVSPSRQLSQSSFGLSNRPQVTRAPTQELEFVTPTGDASFDPLERWKGAPVYKFGFGGTTISTFPKHVPRYSAGAVRPLIKSTAGEVLVKNSKESAQLSEALTTFPGPLRIKSKKKDAVSWLSSQISNFEAESVPHGLDHVVPDPAKRHEEKILLWKVVRALVEHDGVLDSIEGIKSVNNILFPELYALDEASATQYRGDLLDGIYRPSGTRIRADSIEPMAMETLRKQLLRGKRTEAVWQAVDSRLWSHALLIASTLDRSTWTQVVSEFVKREVKTAGENTESLSALYEIFGGNLEACVDQLVPPSARAGMQMVSTVHSTGPTKNALDGLDRWKETLSLVLNNRSTGDSQALAHLANLLTEFGRVEAGHICYLFSRTPAQPPLFGGIDDTQAHITLLGADERTNPLRYGKNHEAIMLTEIYEFATLVLASGSTTQFMPHLSAYKLELARVLAEHGMKSEAQAYCDAIGSTLKANTKVSPYYHPVFLAELDELSSRLRQAPVQASSWLAKPSIEKVSGSVWNKFTTFVSGEDSDAESKTSAKEAAESGPFARVSGTPSLSRSGSQPDLASYPLSAPTIPNTIAASRYAPGGMSSARSSSELHRAHASQTSMSPPSTSYGGYQPSNYEPGHNPQLSAVSQSTGLNFAYENSPVQSPTQQMYAGSEWQNTSPRAPGRRQASQGRGKTPSPAPGQNSSTLIQQAVASYTPRSSSELYMSSRPTNTYMPQTADNPYNPQRSTDLYAPQAGTDPYETPVAVESELPGISPEPTLQPPQPQFGGYLPPTPELIEDRDAHLTETKQSSYDPPSYGYAPPTDNEYVPYEPDPDSDSDDKQKKTKPKKKSFMGNDDDEFSAISARPNVHNEKLAHAEDDEATRKKANDAAAEAAFRAAAEADAAKTKEKADGKKSGSWISGWFGGSKKTEDLSPSKGAAPTVYKAKLGEDKMSLYYDKELKKWVNPNDPDSGKAKTATPPPPRMGGTPLPPAAGGPPMSGPPRVASGTSASLAGPPSAGISSGPPSRLGTPASGMGIGATLPPGIAAGLSQDLSRPSTRGETPPPGAGGLASVVAAGNRPASAVSAASSIDDLIGPAQGRKSVRGPKKGGKAGRYVDIMAG